MQIPFASQFIFGMKTAERGRKIMFRLWVTPVAAFVLVASATVANAASHYEYNVTGHNHFGESVDFSCNGGTPREIHDGASRTVNFHGGETVHANCIATHDGVVVWSNSSHIDHHSPNLSLEITKTDNHKDGS